MDFDVISAHRANGGHTDVVECARVFLLRGRLSSIQWGRKQRLNSLVHSEHKPQCCALGSGMRWPRDSKSTGNEREVSASEEAGVSDGYRRSSQREFDSGRGIKANGSKYS